VRDSGNKIIGALQVLNKIGGAFSTNDEDLLRSLAAQVAIAVRNAEQVDQIQRRRRISEILLDVMKSFSAELDVDQLLRKIMARTSEVMNAERSTLSWSTGKRGDLVQGREGAGLVEIRIPIGAALRAWWRPPERASTSPTRTAILASTGRWTKGPATGRGRSLRPHPQCAGRGRRCREVLNKKGDIFTREDEEFCRPRGAGLHRAR